MVNIFLKTNEIIAGILILIPFVIYIALPLYNSDGPELAGFPFFYWFQTAMLVVSAVFFAIAAYLIDKDEVSS